MEQSINDQPHFSDLLIRKYSQTMGLIFNEIELLNEHQRQFRPEPQAWNSLQVFEHLINVHNGATKSILFGLSKSKKQQAQLSQLWKFYALIFLLYSPAKFKAPEMVHPVKNLSWDLLKDEWRHSQQKISDVVKQIPNEEKSVLIFKHPRAGLLTTNQTLSFLNAHASHHRMQLSKIKISKAYPFS
jgi:hypothetical protein